MAIAGPRDLLEFELRDGTGTTLWAISAEPPQTLESIYYGIVPKGFVQLEPAAGSPPRALIFGEPVTTRTRTVNIFITHRGIASSENGFLVQDHAIEILGPMDRER